MREIHSSGNAWPSPSSATLLPLSSAQLSSALPAPSPFPQGHCWHSAVSFHAVLALVLSIWIMYYQNMKNVLSVICALFCWEGGASQNSHATIHHFTSGDAGK